jgi:hypothetical protein
MELKSSVQERKRKAAAFTYMTIASNQSKYPINLGSPRSEAAKLFMYAAAHSSILAAAAERSEKAYIDDPNPEKERLYKNWEHRQYVGPEESKEVEDEIKKLIKETEHPCEGVVVDDLTSIANSLDEVSEEKDELAPMSGGGFGDLAKAAIAYVTSSCSRKPVELEVVLDDATRELVNARAREPKAPSPAKSWAWMAKAIGAVLASTKIAGALAGNTGLSAHLSTFFNYVAEVADPAVVARNLLTSLGADVQTALSALHASTNVMICACLVVIFYEAVVSGGNAVVAIIQQMRQFVKTLKNSGVIDAAKEQILDLQLLMYLNGINPDLLKSSFLVRAATGAPAPPVEPPPVSALLDTLPSEVVEGPMDKFVKKTGKRAKSPRGGCPMCGGKRKTNKNKKSSKPKQKAGSYRKNRKMSEKRRR